MRRPKVCILRTAGTNCDKETAAAFARVGADAELVHINRLIGKERRLSEFQIFALPGGFSYGDDIAAGKILANELKNLLAQDLRGFIDDGKLIIGICNGFQILVKTGLLPGNDSFTQEATLAINDSAKFEDRWVYLRAPERQSARAPEKCIWTKGLPEIIYLPVAHGEGKFIAKDRKVLARLKKKRQIVFQYCDAQGELSAYPANPNGSQEHIAGICDSTGRILGLMPHPERHMDAMQHPRFRAMQGSKEGDGLQIFRNGVEYATHL
ncbi:MAG: phosphoribosylformylglycinamidine synthase I [Candidatus Omnitrophica bacterium]|nr:phosphoribosylformylglycinamidine synthase I [Candidatus Omnitrophota bacterium]